MTDTARPEISSAIDALEALVREWREAGRVTTTAGLKPGLQQRLDGFSETALGFTSFRDFAQAAADTGRLSLQRLPNGQWIMLLPNESVDDVPTTTADRRSVKEQVTSEALETRPAQLSGRLRPEVWQTFVDWTPDHRRLWDQVNKRCYMVPLDSEGRPKWESEPARFIDIPVADMTMQHEWMREWASALPDETARVALLGTLDVQSPRGGFRYELTQFGLVADWRAELQRRVLTYASGWAGEHNVSLFDLLDHRRPGTATPSAASGRAARETPSTQAAAAKSAKQPPSEPHDDLTRLRAAVHAAVDRMSLAELAALPIRAEHLFHLIP